MLASISDISALGLAAPTEQARHNPLGRIHPLNESDQELPR